MGKGIFSPFQSRRIDGRGNTSGRFLQESIFSIQFEGVQFAVKRISIWGSSGSIGKQAIDVVLRHPGRFEVIALSVHRNASLLLEQANRIRPKTVVITGPPENRGAISKSFQSLGIEVLWGMEGLLETARRGQEDLVLNALVGSAGLEATFSAVRAGVSIALANKEALVMAGELLTREIRERGLSLIPVDSEHSAIFQCLEGENPASVRRILLTASGGPFLNTPGKELEQVTVEQALAHPIWSMGKKVTIDSATMINKGLEVIEARWLFGAAPDQIQVVVHPQSIVHSMVEFRDGSVKAQLGVPDMRIPISHALSYPERLEHDFGRLDFGKIRNLTFQPPDLGKFEGLKLSYEALKAGGTATAVYNAADESAVHLFLSGEIRFLQIARIVREALERHTVRLNPSLDQIIEADRWTREIITQDILKSI
jgi:1-deoxy-D-xylulose-5-phosphate reductoisomerase